MAVYAGKDVEQGEQSFVDGRIANLYNDYGDQYSSFSENWESSYLQIQL